MKILPPYNLGKSAFIEVVEVNNEADYIHETKIPVLCIIDSNTHAYAAMVNLSILTQKALSNYYHKF